METLYRLPTAEGNNKYGNEYKVRAHLHPGKARSDSHNDGAGVAITKQKKKRVWFAGARVGWA